MGEISRFMVTGMVAADAEPTAPPKFPQPVKKKDGDAEKPGAA